MLDDAVFRELLEAAPDGIVIVDAEGRLVLMNREAERLFGYSHREMAGRPIEVLVPARLRVLHNSHRSDFLQEPHSRPMGAGLTLMARRKDGSEFPVEISLSPVESDAGRVVAAIVRDVTERRRAEDTIRSQAELLEFAHDAIIVLDMQRRIQYWNAGAERTYGWTAEEVMGRSIQELLQTAPIGLTVDEMDSALMSESLWEGEVEQVAVDGRRIVVTSRQTMRRGADGAPGSILEINRDITERKLLERERAEAALETQRQHERDRIAMDLHDGVIQSIYAVGLNLESASHDVTADPPAARGQLERSIEQLHAVISDIRSYIFRLRRPDLTTDIGAAILALAANAERSSTMAVKADVADALPRVSDDAMLALYHVAQEALTNALRHSRASVIRIALRSDDAGLILTIEDDGVGFDALAERGDHHNGVRNMAARADAVGGRLALHSEPGAGSRITLELPV